MNSRFLQIICRLAGLTVAILGLIPGVKFCYEYIFHWRRWESQHPMEGAYVGVYLLQFGIIAFAGLAIGYLLFRLGIWSKSQKSPDKKA